LKGKRLEEALREYALAYPEATEEFPWGERALKVRGKIFAFVGSVDGDVRLTLKLPASGAAALAVPGAARAGYGLGKAGWVSLRLATDGLPAAGGASRRMGRRELPRGRAEATGEDADCALNARALTCFIGCDGATAL
jgi:predicted DNA-binding protein (MmcQ/YjbR family)